MSFLDQLGIELKEKRDDEQSDVHAVDIGIGSHDNLVVAQVVESLLDIEGGLKQVKLLVLIDHLLRQSEAVERFAAQ